MRKTFINTLIDLAENDKNIYLLTGDLGFSVFEDFARKFPERFINCGVAEQNMMGVAAGLALEGKKVYVYSIIPFVVFRCFEQIRNDICYQNLDVKIVGAGAGFSYGTQGATHHAIEDLAILRNLPNIAILSPADPKEMEQLVLQSYNIKNPTYIRLNKNDRNLYSSKPKITIGIPAVLKDGKDGVIITTGAILETSIKVIQRLANEGYNLKLISMHTIKPINEKVLLKEIKGQKLIFTLEEHSKIGGLASSVGEILLKNNVKDIIFESMGTESNYSGVVGKQDYLRRCCKIDEESVFEQIIKSLKR